LLNARHSTRNAWSCVYNKSISKLSTRDDFSPRITFGFAARPSVNKVLIAELARCEYIDKRENVIMVANSGIG
jgi:hypothetical protein